MKCSNYQQLKMIIQIINIILSFLFLCAFGYRYYRLSKQSTPLKHISKYPKVRIILSLTYAIMSCISQITQSLVCQYFIFLGQFINSLVLIAHLVVLRVQLKKQKTFTRFHLLYMMVLLAFSVLRIVPLCFDQQDQIIIIIFKCLLLVPSVVMLVLWLRKRKHLAGFIDLAEYQSASKEDFGRLLSKGHINYCGLSEDYKREPHEKIFVTVRTEKGRIRIILQTFANNEILSSKILQQSNSQADGYRPPNSSFSSRTNQHRQIISNHVYTINEINHIYIECNRFDLNSRLHFKNLNMGQFYQSLNRYLSQLFALRKSYTPEILQLFHVDKQSIQQIIDGVRLSSINEAQLTEYTDLNAIVLSVDIYKQFWDEDHYVFYMSIRTVCSHNSAVIHKRFSDFQQFHKQLHEEVHYKLPELPKKHLFRQSEQSKMIEKRKLLQNYCRQISNDLNLLKMPHAKEIISNFFNFSPFFTIEKQVKTHQRYYQNLQIKKGKIMQALIGEDYVTFYQFNILKNSVFSHSIIRRFSEFAELHESVQRWMKNIQIIYEFLTLPDKFLFSSHTERHEKLKKYLQELLRIKQIYTIYSVTNFLNLGKQPDQHSSEHGLSVIRRSSSHEKARSHIKKDMSPDQQQSSYTGSSKMESSNVSSPKFDGMSSELIEDLNADQN